MALPVYFVGHGGPNVMYETDHPAYSKLGEIGREITTKVKPNAIVVVSAHWQAGGSMGLGGSGQGARVQVNVGDGKEGLIYDFYGFPKHYYEEKFPYVGSTEVAGEVMTKLQKAGFSVEPTKRGLDHGVWASFKCRKFTIRSPRENVTKHEPEFTILVFDLERNPIKVPIVQVSLPSTTTDPTTHYAMGKALASLRAPPYNYLIVGSGMAVHNLRDYMYALSDEPMPYTKSFDKALKNACEIDPAQREEAMGKLLDRPDTRKAHPILDHLWPIYFAAGAADGEKGKRIWTFQEGSMSWAQYRFGNLNSSTL
ncbi:MAG: hypothetical protein M1834_009330 [Cirrosporium novae-zelandiae]|nr:MAG: hypothetical protein M1834_009330 [Cirrosporium novae-zelandiae]